MYKVTIHVPIAKDLSDIQRTQLIGVAQVVGPKLPLLDEQTYPAVFVRNLCLFMGRTPPFVCRARDGGDRVSYNIWGPNTEPFDAGGIIAETRPARQGAFAVRIQFSKIERIEYRIGENGKRTKHLGFDDWVEFNRLINEWLDGWHFSSEVRSSSFIVRWRDKRRVQFTRGDYHGLKDAWELSYQRESIPAPPPTY